MLMSDTLLWLLTAGEWLAITAPIFDVSKVLAHVPFAMHVYHIIAPVCNFIDAFIKRLLSDIADVRYCMNVNWRERGRRIQQQE